MGTEGGKKPVEGRPVGGSRAKRVNRGERGPEKRASWGAGLSERRESESDPAGGPARKTVAAQRENFI